MQNSNTLTMNKFNYVYIPILDDDMTIIPKVGDYVYKDSILAQTKGDNKQYIFSSISGHVENIISKSLYIDGIQEKKCIVIANDFKEIALNLKGTNKHIDKILKEDFIEKIKINYLTDNLNNPLYLNYENNIDTLIINACELGNLLNHFFLNSYLANILETIDALIEINNIKKCYLIVNKSDKVLLRKIEENIGTYLNINLIKSSKDVANDEIKKDLKLKTNYHFESLNNIYLIYDILKNNNFAIERYIAVLNNNNTYYIKTKIGSSINDILNLLNINYENIILGNGVCGTKTNNKDIIVSQTLDGVIVNNLNKEEKCIKCGKCHLNCPYNLMPLEFIKYKNDPKMLKKLNIDKCTLCGVCSYNCPSFIDLNKELKSIKEVNHE